MKKTFYRKAHRWLGLAFSLTILMSAGSGVLHNVMTYTQKPPPPARPSGGGLDVSRAQLPIAEAVARLQQKDVQAVNLRGINGEPWYQVFTSSGDKPAYVSAVDGRVDPSQDERYAEQIASAFLGGVQVVKAGFLTEFDKEYINIFRMLPVYRFNAADSLNTRVYVSTLTGSVTRHTDDKRQFEASVFTNFHKFGFIPNKLARDIILTTVTLGAFIVSILGIVLFFVTSPTLARSKKQT